MSTMTLEAPATRSIRSTRRHARQSAAVATQAHSASLEITGQPDTEIGGDQMALARDPRNVACKARCKAARQAMLARQVSERTTAAVVAWEAASEAASRLYGEMNAIETEIMDAMMKRGIKSLRLSDGRMLVVLDYAKDPCGPTGIWADYITILPADVVPE